MGLHFFAEDFRNRKDKVIKLNIRLILFSRSKVLN